MGPCGCQFSVLLAVFSALELRVLFHFWSTCSFGVRLTWLRSAADLCLALEKEVAVNFETCNCQCLRVVPDGRWGNNLLQILKACHIAEHLQIPVVRVDFHFAFVTEPLPWSEHVTIVPEADHKEPCFTARFFNLAKTHRIRISFELTETFKRAYRASLGVRALNDSVLVAHLRSGDIFGRLVHPVYAQPPCSYYTDVVHSRPWSAVLVFAEDYKNPCVKIVARARREVEMHVGGLLLPELRVLLGARNLAIGRGTFGLMASLLTVDLLRLYTFNQSQGLQCAFPRSRIVNCEPSASFYRTNVKYWRNTAAQVHFMRTANCASWVSGYVEHNACAVEDVLYSLQIR